MKSQKSTTSSSTSRQPVMGSKQGGTRRFDFSRALELMEAAVAERAFPGAVLALAQKQQTIFCRAFGRFTYANDSPEVTPGTIYDLASLTKVVATTTMAMLLYERAALTLDQPVIEIVPEFEYSQGERSGAAKPDVRKRSVTLRMLLAHSSGLPAYRRLFELTDNVREALELAFATPLEADPMTRGEYSDIGFIVLGVALERLSKEDLRSFCSREIFARLGMRDTFFSPSLHLRSVIPPTSEDCKVRHRMIQGEVNDENASLLGGVAGHAGLFSNAADIQKFAACMLRGGEPILKPETVKTFTAREDLPAGTSRALGWDTPSVPSQSGQFFPPRSYGHLGFTGTSLWIDPEREVSVTLLTNRTWPDAKSQTIKQVRPAVHDAIMKAITGTE